MRIKRSWFLLVPKKNKLVNFLPVPRQLLTAPEPSRHWAAVCRAEAELPPAGNDFSEGAGLRSDRSGCGERKPKTKRHFSLLVKVSF